MKFKSYKRILAVFLLLLIVTPICSNLVYGTINEKLYEEIKTTSVISASFLTKLLSSDILIDPLGKLIFSIGNLIESLVGSLMLAATGNNMFPWADAIVFNAVPLLDVNYINPYNGSDTEKSIISGLQGTIKNIYYSLFAIAKLFFGIAVLLMGIKLALSTIASDKAKYKEALTKWLIGFILLYGIQFFISFVFYLNEQLVIAASALVDTQDAKDKISSSVNFSLPGSTEIVTNFANSAGNVTITDILGSLIPRCKLTRNASKRLYVND